MIFKTNPTKEFYTDERCHIIEILNDQSIENVSIAQARVEPHVTTQLHSLRVDEMYYILQGHGIIEVNGTKRKEVVKGDVAYIKSGESQRIRNTSDSDLVFLCICVPKFNIATYTSLE